MIYLKTFEQAINDQITDSVTAEAPELGPVQDGGIKADTFEAVKSGWGDYEVSFKNESGQDLKVVFKDTGNRRDGGDILYAAFVGMEPAEDGKEYVAEATMNKVEEGEYALSFFTIYEKQS